MRVVIDAALFDDAKTDALALLDVLAAGVEGRHVVLIDPPLRTSAAAKTSFQRWIDRLLAADGSIARSLRDHYERQSTRDDRASLRSEIRIVAADRSAWTARPPRVTPRDAQRITREPLTVVLEDAVNDGAFLLALTAVAGDAGTRLRDGLSRAWLRIVHGGGIGSIPRLLRALDEEPTRRLRCHVIVDHDGDTPGAPSGSSLRVEEECAERDVPFHRLRRRAIENYAPRKALDRWARGELFVRKEVADELKWKKIVESATNDATLASRRAAFQVWEEMSPEERHHAPLKTLLCEDIAERVFAGFVAGKPRPGGAPQPERFVVQPEWLRSEGCAAEAEHLVESVLRSA